MSLSRSGLAPLYSVVPEVPETLEPTVPTCEKGSTPRGEGETNIVEGQDAGYVKQRHVLSRAINRDFLNCSYHSG